MLDTKKRSVDMHVKGDLPLMQDTLKVQRVSPNAVRPRLYKCRLAGLCDLLKPHVMRHFFKPVRRVSPCIVAQPSSKASVLL